MLDPRALALIQRWQLRPDLFCSEALGVDPWDGQLRVLGAMSRAFDGKKKVAVRSGNKCGKTTVAAWVALWWLTCFRDAKVIATAPTGTQVRRQFWAELRKAHMRAKLPLGGRLALVPDAGLDYEDGRICIGVTTNEPERMAGYSGERLLYIVDEASGVKAPIYEAIEGNLASGGCQLLISNPTNTSGEFFDAFHRSRALYARVHLSSFDASRAGKPGLANAAWLHAREIAWGTDSSAYQVRCLGMFPTEGSDQIFPLSLIDRATDLEAYYAAKNQETDGILQLGVDPARFGDDESVIYPRRGKRLLHPLAFLHLDGRQLAGRVMAAAQKLRRDGERVRVVVDENGVGASVVDQLRDEKDIELVPIVGSETADDSSEHGNLRASVIFGFRDWLRDGGLMPRDEKRDGEMLAHRSIFDPKGRLMVLKKDKIKEEIRRSPDRSDAASLACYEGSRPVRFPGVVRHTDFDSISLAD